MGESNALAKLLSRWPENKVNPSLDRIQALLGALGNPEHSFKSIHIAGTNGKTSTARMVQQILLELNLRVGLYTSPHLIHPRERILVDGISMLEKDFEDLYERFEPILELVEQEAEDKKLTFFEAITAMAFMYFSEVPIDIGVIEVGLGGRWDATNVIDSAVSVITPISFDHKDYLGETLSDIAFEKAGILKANTWAVISKQQPVAEQTIKSELINKNVKSFWQNQDYFITRRELALGGQVFDLTTPFGKYKDIFLNLHGEFQVQNAATAICATEAFVNEKINSELIVSAFEKVQSPGRLEIIKRNPTVIIDAAHNPEGVRVTREAIEESFNFHNRVLIIGVMQDKEVSEIIKNLVGFASKIICTQIDSSRALNAMELANLVKLQIRDSEVSFNFDIKDALSEGIAYAQAQTQCGVVIMGSIALIGAIKALM